MNTSGVNAAILPSIQKATPPPSASAHWYAGAVLPWWDWGNNVGQVWVTIQVPNISPNPNEFYYVLLSAFDSVGSYDQIGFSNDWGIWGLTTSWTYNSNGQFVYVYNPDVMNLQQGTTYTFCLMTTPGSIMWDVYQNGGLVFFQRVTNGANYISWQIITMKTGNIMWIIQIMKRFGTLNILEDLLNRVFPSPIIIG